jgi:hypothetical protein
MQKQEIILKGNEKDISLLVHIPETESEVFKTFWTDEDFINMSHKEALKETLRLYPDVKLLLDLEDRNTLGEPINAIRSIWQELGGRNSEIGDIEKIKVLFNMNDTEADCLITSVITGLLKRNDIIPMIENRKEEWIKDVENGSNIILKYELEPLTGLKI